MWEGSTDTVLVMERVDGISLGEESVGRLGREEKDEVRNYRRIIQCIEMRGLRLTFDTGCLDRVSHYRAVFEGVVRVQGDADGSELE